MRKFRNLVIGGIESKIFNLILIVIILLCGVFIGVTLFQRNSLTSLTAETSAKQQETTSAIISDTMNQVMRTTMDSTTGMEAQIVDDLFRSMEARVRTVADYATKIYADPDSFRTTENTVPDGPDASREGTLSTLVIWADGVDPEDPAIQEAAGLTANLSELMMSLCKSTDSDNVYIGTKDGIFLMATTTSGQWFGEDGKVKSYDTRTRPWYRQAAEAGGLVFSDLEKDANTGELCVTCAMPVYGPDGEIMAVVGSDIFLHTMEKIVREFVSDGGYAWIVNQSGHVIYSPNQDLIQINESAHAPDLRKSENADLARIVNDAMSGKTKTDVRIVNVNGYDFYMLGVPIETVGWTLFTAFPKDSVDQVEVTLLDSYDKITNDARTVYQDKSRKSSTMMQIVIVMLALAAIAGALVMGKRIVKPLNSITRRIANLKEGNLVFKMEESDRTGDEIQVLAESFASLSEKTIQYVEQVKTAAAEKERISTELHMANRIQESMLPHVFPPFPDRKEFDIYATMDPAREVGGDFYDFYLIDPDHLCIVMADVSGKGVPAALFMMISKTILQSCAMLGQSAGAILNKTNEALCSNNQTDMFVTVWLGILEISTGRLTCANAGHEYPVMFSKNGDGKFTLIKDKHGFVIGGLEQAKYKEYELQMKPGDKLFVYTDGVPEATDSSEHMFGTEQMIQTLNSVPDATPKEVLATVKEAVNEFVGNAEQFDDLTMLCLEYKGAE